VDFYSPIVLAVPAELPVAAVSAVTKLLRDLSKLFDDQQQKQSARADYIDRKRARELRQKRQAQGHARDEQVKVIDGYYSKISECVPVSESISVNTPLSIL
jgi:hypothetical protein